jgi:excisionase family DNA binding protein
MSNDITPEKEKRHWFSIKEASEYLDIGEPTLYRWMREGKITYRKVGDSTRFWQEDLDAVMEVFHSDKEVENVKRVCHYCHSSDLVEGVFRTTGLNWFQPKKTKFWTLKDSSIESQSFMCAKCGAIFLFGDLKKLNELRDAQPKSTAVEIENPKSREK